MHEGLLPLLLVAAGIFAPKFSIILFVGGILQSIRGFLKCYQHTDWGVEEYQVSYIFKLF